jgi:hypothetical protein
MGRYNFSDWVMALPGFVAGDADQDDLVTGQTSFAATTPTFLLRVPAGTTAIPLFFNLAQGGTVAGGAIDVIAEIDNADRFDTGGAAETIFPTLTSGGPDPLCTLRSGATALAGFGQRVDSWRVTADVAPVSTDIIPKIVWRAEETYRLVGPASFLIFTYAGTTGPSWFWSIGWKEVPTVNLRGRTG